MGGGITARLATVVTTPNDVAVGVHDHRTDWDIPARYSALCF